MVPDPPVSIDLSGGGGDRPWPAFTMSGVTGTYAAELNIIYILATFEVEWTFRGNGVLGDSPCIYLSNTPQEEWTISDGPGNTRFMGYGKWPWTVTEWEPVDGGAGTPVFTRELAAPHGIALGDAAATATALLATSLAGSNKDLVFTSKLPGRLGNDVTVRYLNPGMSNAALAVSVSGRDITVRLATNGGGVITSTAAQVRTAMQASSAASALVTVGNKAGSDGSGVVTAMAVTALGGGLGGLPLPPVAMALG